MIVDGFILVLIARCLAQVPSQLGLPSVLSRLDLRIAHHKLGRERLSVSQQDLILLVELLNHRWVGQSEILAQFDDIVTNTELSVGGPAGSEEAAGGGVPIGLGWWARR